MKRQKERHPLFGSLRPPGAPAELRERTLEAARAVPAEPVESAEPIDSQGRSLTDRLWESRRLRLAWALLMVGLLGANLHLELDRRASLPEAARHAVREASARQEPGERLTLLAARQVGLGSLLSEESDRNHRDPSFDRPSQPSGRTL